MQALVGDARLRGTRREDAIGKKKDGSDNGVHPRLRLITLSSIGACIHIAVVLLSCRSNVLDLGLTD